MPRPGHADLQGAAKYGFNDMRNVIERASARETVGRVAGGAVCRQLLSEAGVAVKARVLRIGAVEAPDEFFRLSRKHRSADHFDPAGPGGNVFFDEHEFLWKVIFKIACDFTRKFFSSLYRSKICIKHIS